MRGAYSRSKGLPRIAVAFKTAGEGGKRSVLVFGDIAPIPVTMPLAFGEGVGDVERFAGFGVIDVGHTHSLAAGPGNDAQTGHGYCGTMSSHTRQRSGS